MVVVLVWFAAAVEVAFFVGREDPGVLVSSVVVFVFVIFSEALRNTMLFKGQSKNVFELQPFRWF